MSMHEHDMHKDGRLSAEERALAELLGTGSSQLQPSADLDARILAAAHAPLQQPVGAAPVRPVPTRSRSRRRWPLAFAAAAALVLVVGVAWQLRPVDEAPMLRSTSAEIDSSFSRSGPNADAHDERMQASAPEEHQVAAADAAAENAHTAATPETAEDVQAASASAAIEADQQAGTRRAQSVPMQEPTPAAESARARDDRSASRQDNSAVAHEAAPPAPPAPPTPAPSSSPQSEPGALLSAPAAPAAPTVPAAVDTPAGRSLDSVEVTGTRLPAAAAAKSLRTAPISAATRSPAPKATTKPTSTGMVERIALPPPTAADTAEPNRAVQQMRQREEVDQDDQAGDDQPPATVNSPRVQLAWLQRVRSLIADGNIDAARDSLHEFKRRYPDYTLPQDLQALVGQ